MDALTHLFLPTTIAYVLFPDLFERRRYLALGVFGLLSDFDKFLGVPGTLHSLVTLVPLCVGLVAAERLLRGAVRYSPVVAGIVLSHPLLDVVEGGPAPLLAPLVETGVGFRYPVRVSFGEGLLGIRFHGPFVELVSTTPRPGFNTYGFVNGFGVTSMLVFVVLFVGLEWTRRRSSDGRA